MINMVEAREMPSRGSLPSFLAAVSGAVLLLG